LRYFTETDR